MKKFLVVLSLAVLSIGSAFAQKGQMGAGINVGYGSEIKSPAIGAKFQYGILDKLRGEAAFDYFFEKDGISMWSANLNFHYLINITEKFKVYPIVGLNYSNAKFDFSGMSGDIDIPNIPGFDMSDFIGDSDSGSDSKGYFGGNVGAGLQYDLSSKISLNFDAKYTLMKDIDQFVVSIGAVYHF